MKSRKRIVYRDILNHCYQRGADGIVLFYSVSDHLVYFTTYCVMAQKHNIKVLSLCQMPDHVHDSVVVRQTAQLSRFKQEVNARFSKAQNEACHWDKPLFETPFGSAPKHGAKQARTNLIYVGNNPVERQLKKKAEDYQWNFLAYAESNHPFSQELIVRNCRWPMKCALQEVKAQYKQGKPLNYPLLKRLFAPLNTSEKRQLTDFIICTYNVIDYKEALRYFDSYADMIHAMHSNTGSEYEINEVLIGRSDAWFAKFSTIILRETEFKDIHEIFTLSPIERFEFFKLLRRETEAMSEQIAHYLRLPIKKNAADV